MEPFEAPAYYKGDDGIYRPMIDIRQVPSTSSGIYKPMFWSENASIYHPDSSSTSGTPHSTPLSSKKETNTSNLEASQSKTSEAGNTKAIHQLPPTISRIYRPVNRVSPNLEEYSDVDDLPENTIQHLPVTSTELNKSMDGFTSRDQSLETNLCESNGKDQSLSINSGKPKTVIVPKKKPYNGDSEVSKKVKLQKKLASLLVRTSPEQQDESVDENILQDVGHNDENLINDEQLSLKNYALCPASLPKLLRAKKRKNLLEHIHSQADSVGNNHTVVAKQQKLENSPTVGTPRPVEEKLRNTAAISSLLSKLHTPPEISKGDGDERKTTMAIQQPNSSKTSILGKTDLEGNKEDGIMVVDLQQMTYEYTKYESSELMTSGSPLLHKKLNVSEKDMVVRIPNMQKQSLSSPKTHRPPVKEVQRTFDLLASPLPKKQQAMPTKIAPYPSTSGTVQNKNMAVPSTSGTSSTSPENATPHVKALPKTDQTVKSVAKSSGNERSGLWTLPRTLVIPDMSPLIKYQEHLEIEDTGRVDKDILASCKNELTGLPYDKMITLYFHIMGPNSHPDSSSEITLLALRIMLCGIEQKLLINLIENDKFINFNRVVLWGVNRKRPLNFLFSTVKPDNYSLAEGKICLLKYVKGLFFKNKKAKQPKESIQCQACRKRMDSVLMFVEHLNREPSEITYMCQHCGYLKFTNICALVYHILADNFMKPTREYCVVCGLYCDTLKGHLIDRDNFFNNIKVRCNFCDFEAYSVCSLKLHLSYHTEVLPHICPECGEYFSFKENLDDHMKNVCFINCKFKYYFCTSESCGMIFSYLENFYSHISTEHYERRVICTICQEMFSAQRDFTAHRGKAHVGSMCSYNVYNHCTLCPNSTYRAMSQQKHLSTHGCESKCSVMVYKCHCDFQTRFKRKFIEHKATACHQKTFYRPQVMKICQNCCDVQSFNYMTPEFVCEECQQIRLPTLSLMNYYCELCHLVIDYSWSSVLDHFYIFHKRTDLLSLSLHTMLIISKNKVVPGRYLSQNTIVDVDVDFMNDFINELSGNKNTEMSKSEQMKSITSYIGELNKSIGRIRVRSPSSINAAVSIINHGPSTSKMSQNTLVSKRPQDNSPINIKTKELIPPTKVGQTKLNTDQSNFKLSVPTFKGSKIGRQDIFFCRECNFTSCEQSEMFHHCQNHIPSEYACSECSLSFKTPSARYNHLINTHGLVLLSGTKNYLKSAQHGAVQKILKQQIQEKMSYKQPEKRLFINYEQAKGIQGNNDIVFEIED